ncbi:DNA cytosine methyltransferase [Arabiibacter massiliensis]|uniref:DNA cytosine methyltransferase n=1 Tax=Arabiibacter massiliensis TaxID=1870985 RepID=UPI0009BADF4B|nr:DNA cytosine methyltransferase [Arabiibacter massiliensis]
MADSSQNVQGPHVSPRVVSLFSGAGGLDLGFKQSGFDVVWANDIDEHAVETYRLNIGDHIVLADISDVSLSDIPDCDVLVGGFPCQGFSVANTKRTLDDERNQLYKQYLRILKSKKPKAFIAENVKGILSIGGGEVIERIVSEFSDVGYDVSYKLLNAADYGVPQTRQRVIIAGVRSDLGIEFHFPEASHTPGADEDGRAWLTVGEALKGIPDPDGPEADSVPNNVYSSYKLVMNGYLGKRPIDPDKPAPTVTARGDRKGGVVVLPHPSGERRMTVRELARVQDFPLDFEFTGSRTDCYRQIGNAVPVGLARAVASAMMNALKASA